MMIHTPYIPRELNPTQWYEIESALNGSLPKARSLYFIRNLVGGAALLMAAISTVEPRKLRGLPFIPTTKPTQLILGGLASCATIRCHLQACNLDPEAQRQHFSMLCTGQLTYRNLSNNERQALSTLTPQTVDVLFRQTLLHHSVTEFAQIHSATPFSYLSPTAKAYARQTFLCDPQVRQDVQNGWDPFLTCHKETLAHLQIERQMLLPLLELAYPLEADPSQWLTKLRATGGWRFMTQRAPWLDPSYKDALVWRDSALFPYLCRILIQQVAELWQRKGKYIDCFQRVIRTDIAPQDLRGLGIRRDDLVDWVDVYLDLRKPKTSFLDIHNKHRTISCPVGAREGCRDCDHTLTCDEPPDACQSCHGAQDHGATYPWSEEDKELMRKKWSALKPLIQVTYKRIYSFLTPG